MGHTTYRQLQSNTDNKHKYFLKVFFRGYFIKIVKIKCVKVTANINYYMFKKNITQLCEDAKFMFMYCRLLDNT